MVQQPKPSGVKAGSGELKEDFRKNFRLYLAQIIIPVMRQFFILTLIILPSISFGQFGINFHQSNLPFVGVNYEIKNKWRPELRIGTDNYFEAMSVEGVITYDFSNKENYELYAGLGGRVNGFAGLVVPLGLNIYPLSAKQFGFHIELAPIISEASLLRGSWGIRYRFIK